MHRKELHYPLNKRMDESQSQFWHFGEENIFRLYRDLNPGPSSLWLVPILTELSWRLFNVECLVLAGTCFGILLVLCGIALCCLDKMWNT